MQTFNLDVRRAAGLNFRLIDEQKHIKHWRLFINTCRAFLGLFPFKHIKLSHSFNVHICVCSDCAEKETAPEGRDDVVARKLWEVSTRLVGLKNTC